MKDVILVQFAEASWFQLVQEHGESFEVPFEKAVSLLRRFPEMGSPWIVDTVRRLVFRPRKWGIYYTVSGNRILILAIEDLRQSPEKVRLKIKKLLP